MELAFAAIASLTIVSAVAAMSFRNLIHCALALMVTFTGLACLYLQLQAQFVGLVQVLVYIGAVAILIVFAILLTRNSTATSNLVVMSPSWLVGLVVAVLVLGSLFSSISQSTALPRAAPPTGEVTTADIGEKLMTEYVLPLEVVGVLLTAAMIGAVIICMSERAAESSSAAMQSRRRGTQDSSEKSAA